MKTTDIFGTNDAGEEKKEKKKVCVGDGVVNMYFQGVREFKLLTADEEKELSRKAKKGDMQAQEAFITANLRLVISIAKKYYRNVVHLEMSDLIQAGNEGLIKAVRGFDPDHGGRFSTYATHWIHQALLCEVGSCEYTIRNPMHVIGKLQRYNRAVRRLTHRIGREPDISEIAAEVCESEEWIHKKREIFKKYVSFDEPVLDGDRTLGDCIAGSDGTEAEALIFRSECKEKFAEIFDSSPLSDVQKEVLRLRYGINGNNGEGLTHEKISLRFGVTRERIRQIEAKALRKLEKYLKRFDEFL
ncbi:MAG: RNA polymerase sigma factor RpoD/SigA [Patescibacteria group bacterium]